jgi:alkylated DNA repair dioxygenase AlkB
MGRMRGEVVRPAGLTYVPDLLGPAEEAALLEVLGSWEYDAVVLHDQPARRTVRHFGVRYRFDPPAVVPGEPLPADLVALRQRCAALTATDPERLVEALVTRYPPGATIGWHRDAPMFGPTVVGVSLRSSCLLRFQRRVAGQRQVFEQPLAPRSAYLLAGAARASWQHSIPPVAGLRYSVTFRSLRAAAARRTGPG